MNIELKLQKHELHKNINKQGEASIVSNKRWAMLVAYTIYWAFEM